MWTFGFSESQQERIIDAVYVNRNSDERKVIENHHTIRSNRCCKTRHFSVCIMIAILVTFDQHQRFSEQMSLYDVDAAYSNCI